MEAGDGALTPDRRPAPSRDARRSPALAATLVSMDRHVSDREPRRHRHHECEGPPAPDPNPGTRPQRAEPHAISPLPAGPAVAQGIVALMGGDCGPQAPVGRPEPGPGSAEMRHSLLIYPWQERDLKVIVRATTLLLKKNSSLQRSKYRHSGEYTVEEQNSLRRE